MLVINRHIGQIIIDFTLFNYLLHINIIHSFIFISMLSILFDDANGSCMVGATDLSDVQCNPQSFFGYLGIACALVFASKSLTQTLDQPMVLLNQE
jgi:hypothetical protein